MSFPGHVYFKNSSSQRPYEDNLQPWYGEMSGNGELQACTHLPTKAVYPRPSLYRSEIKGCISGVNEAGQNAYYVANDKNKKAAPATAKVPFDWNMVGKTINARW